MDKMKEEGLARKSIQQLPSVILGPSMAEMTAQFQWQQVRGLNLNENCLGPSPKVVAAIMQAASSVNRYPDSAANALRAKIAAKYQIADTMIMFTNGGDNGFSCLTKAFVNEGDEVVFADPSFGVYDVAVKSIGGVSVKVPLKNFVHDLDAMAAAITAKTKMVFICNPNNPTSTIVTQRELDNFMAQVPSSCVVVIDEAYGEFADVDVYPKTMQYVQAGGNVVILKTFSKFYALAGLRIGYLIAPQGLMDILRKSVEVFAVNSIAQAAAIAALDDEDYAQKVSREISLGKKYLLTNLTALGCTCLNSQANFIFADFKVPTKPLCEQMMKKGILFKSGDNWGFPTFARISIGTQEDNRALIDELKKSI